MIHCAVQNLDLYDSEVNGVRAGLRSSYTDEEFALLLLATPVPFSYEPGTETFPVSDRPHILNNRHVLNQSLNYKVRGKTIKELMTNLNPLEFYNVIRTVDLSDCPLTSIYKSQSVLKDVVGVRAIHWAIHYRGVLSVNKNLIHAAFNNQDSDLPGVDKALMAVYNKTLENFGNGKRTENSKFN